MGKDLTALYATLGILFIFILALAIAYLIFCIIGTVKLFQKAGKSGWEAIIPFYNKWVLTEISGLAWYWFLLLIAPTIISLIDRNLSSLGLIAQIFGNFMCFYNLSKKFHKDTGFIVLGTLLGGIMIPIIGISNSYTYDNTVPVTENGPFGSTPNTNNQSTTTTTATTTTQANKFCPNCGKPTEENDEFCKNCGTKLK